MNRFAVKFLRLMTPRKKRGHPLFASHLVMCSLENTMSQLKATISGLTVAEAEERHKLHGDNEVAREHVSPWYIQLIATFKNPFVLVLVFLGAISYATHDYKAFIVINTMVIISVLLQFWQEFRSGKAAEKLQAMVTNRATVIRQMEDGRAIRREIPMQNLVPGDIVQLSAGDMVPADIRLITSRDLFVSQAILTGESIPVEKTHIINDVFSDEPSEHPNVCLMGTNIVSGIATGVVVSTGHETYFGSLAKSIVGQRAVTSFDKGIRSVSWVLIRFMAVTVPLVLFLNGFTKGDWMHAFFFAVSIAVGLTPEMFPVIVTSNLAKGAMVLSKRKVIVKRLNAIQNFGAMNILCTDKTGTLTQDKIILQYNLDTNGVENNDVLKLAYLNSTHQTGLKNLLDVAVIEHFDERKLYEEIKNYKKIDEIPFDFVRRRMSVIVEDKETEKHILICKGAVEELLSISTHAEVGGETVVLDEIGKRQMRKLTRKLNMDGFRVICLAYKETPEVRTQYTVADEKKLTLKGFLAFLDPPKETAASAISALQQHGVGIKILTGDNIVVTNKICKEVGLMVESSMLGKDIDKLDDEALYRVVENTTIFAKMSPLQKARVIKALQHNGHTVGFLGDGINDAPALRQADIGISVDTATDIAKEAADIILLEKSLLVLEEGVIEGRKIFGNIIKYIKMTASSNFGNIFSVLGASVLLPFLPMMPIHLLIQNILYDISQTAIPFDRMDKEYIKKPRKWKAEDMGKFMLFIGPVSSIFDYTTYALMWHVFGADTPAEQALFQTGWFVEGLLSQVLVVYMIRTEKIPFLQSRPTLPLVLMSFIIIGLGIYIPFSPIGHAVGFVSLPLNYFYWLAATLVGYCILMQIVKILYIRKFGSWL